MNLYLAERDPQHHAWAKRGVEANDFRLRILLSYWYYKDSNLDELFAKYFTRPFPEVFADSGGYSAFTQGATIGCGEYADWIGRWQHLFTAYANLDVIGDHAKTMQNQRTLEGLGLAPIPVFHAGSDYAALEELVSEYPYVALGGLVPYMRHSERVMPHLVKCFKIAQGKAVYHGFGVTSWAVLRALPWYSVDSSSWGQGFRYGQVPLFDAAKGRFVKIDLGDRHGWYRYAALVRELGFDPGDFADRARNDRAKICAISALSFMMAEQWLRKRHGEVHIPARPGAPAVLRAHLADANPMRFVEAVGPRLHLSDTSNGINFGDADKGLKVHLADARPDSGGDLAAAACGIRLHLAEHSLDRGGVGDTSRALDWLASSRKANLL